MIRRPANEEVVDEFWYYLKGLRKITISLGKSVCVSRFETAVPRIRWTATLHMHHYE